MPAKPAHIPSLTPLRGIAAVLVIIYHTDSLLRAQHLGRLVYGTGFFARGYLWVDFFFVLSGFIITHVYGDWFTPRISAAPLRNYLLARFARLYPLYLFALGVTVVLYLAVLKRMPGSGFDVQLEDTALSLPDAAWLWACPFGLERPRLVHRSRMVDVSAGASPVPITPSGRFGAYVCRSRSVCEWPSGLRPFPSAPRSGYHL